MFLSPDQILERYTGASLRDAVRSARSPKRDLTAEEIGARTDKYFDRMGRIVEKSGDVEAVYGFFIRRPTLSACGLAFEWLRNVAQAQKKTFSLHCPASEGAWVGGGEPLFYLKGHLGFLAPLETLLLQKVGSACVAAYNAREMARALPKTPFMAMDARHCAGAEMQEMMAYGVGVASESARREGAVGFMSNANDYTAGFFGQKSGFGTMPHALVGYAGSTLRAAELFAKWFPKDKLAVLVDYFGREVSDALEVCEKFRARAVRGEVSVRLDTHGGRFLEGLDPQSSYRVIEKYAPQVIRTYRSEDELKHFIGTGVSAAAVWHMRERLDEAGFDKVGIIVSSGFDALKCRLMHEANAPIDMVGTGSFLPRSWPETYATADIVRYDGQKRVKAGREFLSGAYPE